jgi:hypothetical protein
MVDIPKQEIEKWNREGTPLRVSGKKANFIYKP